MNIVRFFVLIILSNSYSFSYANAFPQYKGAEAFTPLIRDQLSFNESIQKYQPIENSITACNVIQLTDDTFWRCQKGSCFSPDDWRIGQSVLIERGMDQNQDSYFLVNLATAARQKINPLSRWYVQQYIEVEEEGSDRYYVLPFFDKPCLFKLNSSIDRVQIGARKILWEFEPVVYNYLPLLDWSRGVIVNIHGSGHLDYPYWIVYNTEDGTWVPALLVKPNPIQIASIEANL